VKSRTSSKDLWKIKFFWDNAENAKNDANILKNIFFFGFSLFFAIFGFFKNFIKKMGQKLSSNSCPLFTMLTKQNSSMFCIVSFVKKRKRKMISLFWATCHFWRKVVYFQRRPAHTRSKWHIFRGDLPTHSHWSIFMGDLPTHTHFGLFSRVTCPFDWVYLRSHLAI